MNYLFLGKSIRNPEYYAEKVASAVRTESAIVVDTEREMELVEKEIKHQGVECECIYMDEFIRRKNNSRA